MNTEETIALERLIKAAAALKAAYMASGGTTYLGVCGEIMRVVQALDAVEAERE